jgi:RND family efflux transporter MFP subunit
METVDRPRGDLRALTREEPAPSVSTVPPPRFKWKTRLLVPGGVLLALLLLIGFAVRDVIVPPRVVRVIPVVVKAGDAASTTSGVSVQAPGWLEADPYPIAVSALAGGVVKEMLALEGQSIKAGDVVARLIDDDARLALAKAEAELADKQAALTAAQRQWDNPIERTRAVATGEAMVAEAVAQIEKHHSDLAVEAAKLEGAKQELDRVKRSAETNAASEIELIRARQMFDAQQATHQAIQSYGAILAAQRRQREADLAAAKDNLRLRIEETSALASAKAAVALATAGRDEAALRLSRMEVRSPADGIVMQRLAEPGSKLLLDMDDPRSAQAARLYDPKRLQVRVDVPLADAAKVGVGMDAKVIVGVLPDRTFSGKVSRVVNEADIQKNTLQVKVAIADPSPELKPEMLARVRFTGARVAAVTAPTGSGNQLVFAPESLIDRGGGMNMVWVVNTRTSRAESRMIELGEARSEGWIAVTSGLRPGDQLISDPKGLSEGQKVRVAGEEGNHGTD